MRIRYGLLAIWINAKHLCLGLNTNSPNLTSLLNKSTTFHVSFSTTITLFLYGIGALGMQTHLLFLNTLHYSYMELEPVSWCCTWSHCNYYIIPIWNWSPQSSRASGNLTELHYSYMELELLPWVLKTSSLHSLHYSYMELEHFSFTYFCFYCW